MKKYYEYDDKKELEKHLKYWSNSLGELHYHGERDITKEELPEQLQRAYSVLYKSRETSCLEYLVEYDGEYYVALVNEFDQCYADDCGVSLEKSYETAKDNALVLYKNQLFEDNTILILGKGTGFEKCHEVFFLIPAMTNRAIYQILNQTISDMIYKRVNTRISYLYRDACNYKFHNEAIIKGELSAQQIDVIMGCLNEGEYFIPSQVGLPEERFGSFTEDDHCWFELSKDGFSPIKEKATVDITADEFVQKFMKAKDKWHDDEIMCQENTMGHTDEYTDIYVYIPEEKKIIYISEGTGDNLLPEDIAEGYVDYINYTIYDLDNGIEESDSGMIMLKELFQGKYSCTKDCIPDVLEFVELEENEFLVL